MSSSRSAAAVLLLLAAHATVRTAMHDQRISADCHIDLPWIPPDLFTANSSAALKDRMPVAGQKFVPA